MKSDRNLGSTIKNMDLSLYLVTDRSLLPKEATLEASVAQALAGGCTIVQLREKEMSSLSFYESALSLKAVTDAFRVPLIINDRMDIALAVDAAGLHVGQSDLPAPVARRLLGPDKILGVSVNTLEEAKKALQEGADYLGVGAMFPTGTKDDAVLVTMEELKRIKKEIPLPIVIIGGINASTLPLFKGTGIDGAAVVSAILAQKDPKSAAQSLRETFSALGV